MSEQQENYVTQDEVQEALDMLGKGYEAPYEIHLPSRVVSEGDEGQQEYQTGVWIKITASFRNKHLKKLKGSRLGVWLCIALHINEKNDSHPSIETICQETGYSNREVINCVRELEKDGYLTVIRGQERYNIYHVNFGAAYGKGKTPTSEESSQVNLSARNSELSSKKMLKSSLKEEPTKKNQKNDDGEAQSVFAVYEQEIGPLTPHLADELDEAEQVHGANWVCEALKIASANGKRNWAYTKAILSRWKSSGYGVQKQDAPPRPEYQPVKAEDKSIYVPKPPNLPRPNIRPAANPGD